MVEVEKSKVLAYAGLLDSMSFLPLGERIICLIGAMKARGEVGVYAKKAQYIALAGSTSTTAQVYKLQTVKEDATLAIVSVAHPSDGTASIIATSMSVDSGDYVHADAVMDAWCDAPASEDARGLPWPIVVGGGGTFTLRVTGTSLPISTSSPAGLAVHGFHIDALTAAVLRQVGELFVEGFNITFAAAATMTEPVRRKFDRAKEFTHLVAKETLTGDTVRASMEFQFKDWRLNPHAGPEAVVIPPLSVRKAGARVSIAVEAGDRADFSYRYTSAAGTGTAILQVTGIGRARYRGC